MVLFTVHTHVEVVDVECEWRGARRVFAERVGKTRRASTQLHRLREALFARCLELQPDKQTHVTL